jgi:hypothetical protein
MDVLVTVKAYPSISQTYGEAICVAGVRIDTPVAQWIRLYPVQFRELQPEQRFSKYAVIRLRARQHSTDRRAETWRPDTDSIQVLQKLPAGGHWPARRRWVEPLIGPTMCELNRGRAGGGPGPSLGLVKPARVADVVVSAADDWSAAQRNTLLQGSLLGGKPTTDLEKPAHSFAYRWYCEEAGCGGHKQTIVDWECGQAYRSWRADGLDPVDAVRQKWLKLCAEDRDVHFFVGDQHQHPGAFLVLGVFWPEYRPDAAQLTLSLAA